MMLRSRISSTPETLCVFVFAGAMILAWLGCGGAESEPGVDDAIPDLSSPAAAIADPAAYRRHFDQGVIFYQAGARTAATKELMRAAELGPREAGPHIFLGMNYFAGNFFTRAEKEFQRAIQLDPGSSEARLGLVRTFDKMGKSHQGLPVLEEVLRSSPDHPEALFFRGRILYRRGEFAAAADDLRRAAVAIPANVEAHYHLGLALMKLNRTAAAVDAFEAAIDRDPGHLGARQNLAIVLRRSGATAAADRAEQEFRRLREEKDRALQALAFRDKAVAAYNSEKYQEALEEFQRIVSINPDDSQAVVYLGSTHLAMGDREAARLHLERGLRLDPENEFAYMELGRLSALEGDLAGAEEYLQRAMTANPDDPRPHYFLAGIYRSQNRIPESEREWAEFLRLQEQGPGAPATSKQREYW
jgi:tetratricopeptide (TPR) repeat protein